jgi:SAM-dependent methyltransferase
MTAKVCLACGSDKLEQVLDLGEQSPVNSFTLSSAELKRYPLGLDACHDCGHGQLMFFVSPEDLFSDYFYASSTSTTLMDYSREFATSLTAGLSKGANILEIASNDGILLRELTSLGFDSTGVDPAERMHRRCIAEGLNTICDFWPSDKLKGRYFDLIVGQNVLAHTPEPQSFLTAAIEQLTQDGLAVFQTSQADMVLNGELDTVYHEHFSFFSENSARALAKRCGAELLATAYTSIHGNSAVFFFGRTPGAKEKASRIVKSLQEKLQPEAINSDGIRLRSHRTIEDWRTFKVEAQRKMTNMRSLVEKSRSEHLKIVSVGAAAKGITFLKASGIEVDLIVDEAEDKIGKWVSGLGRVVSPIRAIEGIGPSLFIISAWNFSKELSQKIRAVIQNTEKGSLVAVYFPAIEITPLAKSPPQ